MITVLKRTSKQVPVETGMKVRYGSSTGVVVTIYHGCGDTSYGVKWDGSHAVTMANYQSWWNGVEVIEDE